MSWIVDLKRDKKSNYVVQELCSAEGDLRLDTACGKGRLGIIVCSERCSWLDIRTALQTATADAQVIVVHVGRSVVDPWAELAVGASDVLRWDDDTEPVQAQLARIREVEEFIDSRTVSEVIVGRSTALRRALRELITAARFGSGPILILGETGTGKELAARVAHQVGCSKSNGQLVVVDCTTIVPGLLGSELFGHERGAFTGAVAARSGACAAADGGALFLDEVGELPLELQPEFMRVVQEGAYKRVGGDRWQHSNFRLICATNRDLSRDVDTGRFRSDLYYRIAASTVLMPPLRERGSDVLDLFAHFYAEASGRCDPVRLDAAVKSALCERTYPGNLRDLRQVAHRVAARHVGGGPITPGDLPPEDRPQCGERDIETSSAAAVDDEALAAAVREAVAVGKTLRELRDEVGDLAVAAAMAECQGNVRAAAARLGVTDRALHLRRARARDTPSPT